MAPADQANTKGIVSPGHLLFAATMIGIGIIGLVQGGFTPTWSGVPRSIPGRVGIAYLCAILSLATGLGILWRRTALGAARVLLGVFLFWLLVVRITYLFRAPTGLNSWWSLGDTLMMTAAAWVLYAWLVRNRDGERLAFATGERGFRIARVLYGLGLIPLGIAHFWNLAGTASLVPSWLPEHVGFAYATGAAFIVAGLAMIAGVFGRLAATLSAWQMGLFTLIVWVPTVVAGPDAGQWNEFVGSWVLTAAGWMVADSYRGVPWLAVGRR